MNAVTYPEPTQEPIAPPQVTSLPRPARSRVGLYAAFGVVGLLVAAIGTYLLWPRPVPPQAELQVTGTAEQVVIAYLHGDRATLERLVAVEIPDTLADGLHYVRSATAVSVLASNEGWEVVVAADHLVAVPGGYGNPRTDHFAVIFHDRPTGPVAMMLPSIVAAPDAPAVRAAAWPSPPADELTAAIESYLRWLVVGGEGSFPGAPVAPPPFTNIALVGMERTAAEGRTEALVAVEGTRPDGSILPLHYSLTLQSTESGWEISLPRS